MKILELRKEKQLSQEEISKQINISQSNYSKYEKQKIEMPIDTAIKLADFYNVSLDYLCDRPFNNNIGYIPEEKKEVVKMILQLNQENTLKLFGYVSGLLAMQE